MRQLVPRTGLLQESPTARGDLRSLPQQPNGDGATWGHGPINPTPSPPAQAESMSKKPKAWVTQHRACTRAGENELTEVPSAAELVAHVMPQARNCILYAKKGTISS